MAEEQRAPTDTTRRNFCRLAIGGLSAATLAAVAYPVASFVLVQPRKVGGDKPVEVALDRLVRGQALYEEFQGLQVIVLPTAEGFQVLRAACPHLGCSVIWDSVEAVFNCPCHGAKFSETGEALSGPVNAPLKKVPFVIKEDKLIIS